MGAGTCIFCSFSRDGLPAMGVAMLLTLSACANMSDGARTRAEGAGAAGVAGVVLAKVAGQSDGTAAIVGVVGAGIGYMVGDSVAKDKEKYAENEDQLKAVTASANQATLAARQANASLTADIAALKQRQQKLATQGGSQSARQAALQLQRKQVQQLIATTKQSIASVDRQLVESRRTLAQQKEPAPAELITVAQRQVKDLDTERQALAASLAQLKLIDQRRAY